MKKDAYNDICKGRNRLSKGDHDTTYMHMKEDAMHNGQLEPGNRSFGFHIRYLSEAVRRVERSTMNSSY